MKKIKPVVYVVTYCNNGEGCDGKPCFGGMFDTLEEAREWVNKDIETYENMGQNVDYDNMSAETCEWNIEEYSK